MTQQKYKLNIESIDRESLTKAANIIGRPIAITVTANEIELRGCISANSIFRTAVVIGEYGLGTIKNKTIHGDISIYCDSVLTDREHDIIQQCCSLHDYIV